MAKYPYPAKDEHGYPKTYLAELSSLARTKPGTGFISSFNDVWALNLDVITNDFCRFGRKEDLSSCDAIYPDDTLSAESIYFIEFKDRSLYELNKQGSDGRDERIDVELSKKIHDSLTMASMTCLREMSMQDIQLRSVFIIVYNDTTPYEEEPKSYSDFVDDMAVYAQAGHDKNGILVMWNLNRFKVHGFCKAVHTWNEKQFREFAQSFMKRTDGTATF